MARDNGSLAQAFRARRPHVLESEHVKQARADLPQIHGEARGRERDGREHEPAKVVSEVLRDRDVAARRKDVAGDHVCEEQDEHDPQEEPRERNASERDARREEIDDRVSLDG